MISPEQFFVKVLLMNNENIMIAKNEIPALPGIYYRKRRKSQEKLERGYLFSTNLW
jgi:hypothetical protein